MKNRLFSIILAIFLPIVSCIDSKEKKDDSPLGAEAFHVVSIDGDYRIDIPKFMTGTTGLNEEASLQYQSLLKEAYLIIIDEPKSGFEEVYRDLEQYDEKLSAIQNYRNARLQILSRTTKINKKSTPEPLKINGLDAEILEVDAVNSNQNYRTTDRKHDKSGEMHRYQSAFERRSSKDSAIVLKVFLCTAFLSFKVQAMIM